MQDQQGLQTCLSERLLISVSGTLPASMKNSNSEKSIAFIFRSLTIRRTISRAVRGMRKVSAGGLE